MVDLTHNALHMANRLDRIMMTEQNSIPVFVSSVRCQIWDSLYSELKQHTGNPRFGLTLCSCHIENVRLSKCQTNTPHSIHSRINATKCTWIILWFTGKPSLIKQGRLQGRHLFGSYEPSCNCIDIVPFLSSMKCTRRKSFIKKNK